MASFAGLRLGSRCSPMRAFSLDPFPCLSKSALFFCRRQLGHAPHPFLFSGARVSYPLLFSSSSAAFFSSSAVFPASVTEELDVAEDDAATYSSPPKARSIVRKFPLLSPKEKKDLRAYAHSLGKKIVSQQVGKGGVTESLAKAISDTLEAKEILKLKVLDNCPDELDDVITKIEEATQGQVVGKIGSVLTIYRPSLRKLSEAQKSQNHSQQGRSRTKGSVRRV